MELMIYQHGADRVICADTEDGREIASQVLCGSRADAEAAEPTGFDPGPLTDEQQRHLNHHGWAPVA